MTYRLPVREWPASEQPREKLMHLGPEHLSEAELLAILLRVGVVGQDVVSLSQSLLVSFGGLLALYRAPLQAFYAVKGISEAKAVTIKAALELGKRLVLVEEMDRLQVRSPSDVATLLQIEMGLLDQEHLRVVLLDTKNHVMGIRQVYRGSVNSSQVRVAEVFRDAVKENIPAIVVAHNHPSGAPRGA
ncbi:MAG: RadC family protein [Chloroflexota bacterium]